MPRPDALGLEFEISSLDDVGKVLAELSWLKAENAKATAWLQQRINAAKKEMAPLLMVDVEGAAMTLSEREMILTAALEEWTAECGKDHFPEGKKSIDLANGSIGLRKIPQTLVVEDDAAAIEKVDELSCGLIRKAKATFGRVVKLIGRCFLSDFVTIKLTLNKDGIADALKEERVTAAKLAEIGIVVVPPVDRPWVKPSEIKTDA